MWRNNDLFNIDSMHYKLTEIVISVNARQIMAIVTASENKSSQAATNKNERYCAVEIRQ